MPRIPTYDNSKVKEEGLPGVRAESGITPSLLDAGAIAAKATALNLAVHPEFVFAVARLTRGH